MAIEIKEYVGDGNITIVNEQAMVPGKKKPVKKTTAKNSKKGAKK